MYRMNCIGSFTEGWYELIELSNTICMIECYPLNIKEYQTVYYPMESVHLCEEIIDDNIIMHFHNKKYNFMYNLQFKTSSTHYEFEDVRIVPQNKIPDIDEEKEFHHIDFREDTYDDISSLQESIDNTPGLILSYHANKGINNTELSIEYRCKLGKIFCNSVSKIYMEVPKIHLGKILFDHKTLILERQPLVLLVA
jgi:hypothetical protein